MRRARCPGCGAQGARVPCGHRTLVHQISTLTRRAVGRATPHAHTHCPLVTASAVRGVEHGTRCSSTEVEVVAPQQEGERRGRERDCSLRSRAQTEAEAAAHPHTGTVRTGTAHTQAPTSSASPSSPPPPHPAPHKPQVCHTHAAKKCGALLVRRDILHLSAALTPFTEDYMIVHSSLYKRR